MNLGMIRIHPKLPDPLTTGALAVQLFASQTLNRGVAQPGQSAAFGTQRSQVQILSPRLLS